MHYNAIDITGKRFGRLLVVGSQQRRNAKGEAILFRECRCDCGKVIQTRTSSLMNGATKSCGCLSREMAAARKLTHGKSRSGRTPAYRAWTAMNRRCNNPKATQYQYYGGAGVRICERWRSFEAFLEDMGEPPEGMTLDRIDHTGNYEQSNCRWADKITQARNRRCVKLSVEKARDIRRDLASGARPCDLARAYGVTPEAIHRVGKREVWKDAG